MWGCGNIAEEAQTSVKGMEENAIHAKYIELVCSRHSPPHSSLHKLLHYSSRN
jgi:hypothetical protein